MEASTGDPRACIEQALARAEATGHSAYLLVHLAPDERAKTALTTWTSALAAAGVRYAMRSSGRRAYRDRGGNARVEIDEILIEVWPEGAEWVAAEVIHTLAEQHVTGNPSFVPR